MRWLIFLSRAAFLSGIFMLAALALGFTSWYATTTAGPAIFLAGYGLAAVLLPLVNLLYLVLLMICRKRLAVVPGWLAIANMLFLIIFLIFTFYLNDPYYYQQ